MFRVPVPRQQVADPFCREIQHACEDIGEPGLRIDVVELGGGDERVGEFHSLARCVASVANWPRQQRLHRPQRVLISNSATMPGCLLEEVGRLGWRPSVFLIHSEFKA